MLSSMTFCGNIYEITSLFFHYGVGMKPVEEGMSPGVFPPPEGRFL